MFTATTRMSLNAVAPSTANNPVRPNHIEGRGMVCDAVVPLTGYWARGVRIVGLGRDARQAVADAQRAFRYTATALNEREGRIALVNRYV